MILSRPYLNVVESDVRRLLAAVQLVDAVTDLPVIAPTVIYPTHAELVRDAGNIDVPFLPTSLVVRQNTSGFHVILRAPHFDAYASTFLDPEDPPETVDGPLRIGFVLEDPGPKYLPQSFSVDLPRGARPEDPDSVFDPVRMIVMRAPSAPVQHGWAVLRVRVFEAGTDPEVPLPGVLLRAYSSPRDAADDPIGWGMTEWRGDLRGEALVPIAGVQRFRPGTNGNVIESNLPVVIEASRLVDFTGALNTYPDVSRILAAIPADAGDSDAGPDVRLVREAHMLDVHAGRSHTIEISMP